MVCPRHLPWLDHNSKIRRFAGRRWALARPRPCPRAGRRRLDAARDRARSPDSRPVVRQTVPPAVCTMTDKRSGSGREGISRRAGARSQSAGLENKPAPSPGGGSGADFNWLRGLDLNQGPQGYEPCELPGCSTPRSVIRGVFCRFADGTQADFTRPNSLRPALEIHCGADAFFLTYPREKQGCRPRWWNNSALHGFVFPVRPGGPGPRSG